MRPAYHADPTPETPHRVLPAMAGGSPEADAYPTPPAPPPVDAARPGGIRCPVIVGLTVLMAAGTVFFGFIPAPLVDFVGGIADTILTAAA